MRPPSLVALRDAVAETKAHQQVVCSFFSPKIRILEGHIPSFAADKSKHCTSYCTASLCMMVREQHQGTRRVRSASECCVVRGSYLLRARLRLFAHGVAGGRERAAYAPECVPCCHKQTSVTDHRPLKRGTPNRGRCSLSTTLGHCPQAPRVVLTPYLTALKNTHLHTCRDPAALRSYREEFGTHNFHMIYIYRSLAEKKTLSLNTNKKNNVQALYHMHIRQSPPSIYECSWGSSDRNVQRLLLGGGVS